ncbi:NAD-dependent epimerase/dehydratase family protein [Bosea caraganae]|uniref:NAD-dependent epimerase/dehydratase family protein n=1 Tax=Bosea caraganae TaxID=2763117 RepID=A0A370L802_9HYPH|nr:GDP-mannose 4,6-dehydratase [Bosea caraganae]RDJ25056.1 NAD-dependent epimerase/dehydratase family protein [Bosea caraganae]RDJ26166.1 NAD-dependent epimerase/dehydratase family protein [Bosea caraganae]
MTMRILITGASGFVGSHLPQALARACGPDIQIIATSKTAGHHPAYGAVDALDVLDKASVAQAIARHDPTHVVHLAGIAAPSAANANPRLAWDAHLGSALNLAEAIRAHAPGCWLLHVGTGMVYGDSAKSGQALDEETLLAPVDDYAASKAAADLALGAMAHRGLNCARFRPFNHCGPGQADAFAIPAFAMQIARIEAGLAPPLLHVGNLDAERDFLDVRDVTDAYALAIRQTATLAPGTIFNIASGVPRRIGDVLESLLALSTVKIGVVRDPARMRPSDLPRIVGNADRARETLGWSPFRRFESTISEVLDEWRAQVARS